MKKTVERILAILLAIVMIAELIPMSALAGSAANPDAFTITVKSAGEPVTDVQVSYTITVNGDVQKTGEVTASDGIAVIADMAEYEAQITGADSVRMSYRINKEGYESVAGEREITVANDNIDITLEKAAVPVVPAEKVKVSASVQGNGTVKLNGSDASGIEAEKGDLVTIELNAGPNAYIKELKIDGAANKEAEGKTTYSTSVTANENVEVSAVFEVYTYTVTAEKTENGTITLNGKSESKITVDKGSSVEVAVEAEEGYQISVVSIGGVQQDKAIGQDKFNANIIVEENITVTAEFMKVYTVTVECNENGTAKVREEQGGQGGTVISVQEGANLEVNAVPNQNYRVYKVEEQIGGNTAKTETFEKNDQTYQKTIKGIKANYKYTITFAANRYNITLDIDNAEGSVVSYENATKSNEMYVADYNTTPRFTIRPKQGYHLSSVMIDNHEQTFNDKEDGTYTFKLPAIAKNVSVKVSFGKNATGVAGKDPLNGTDYKISFVNAKNEAAEALQEYTNETKQKVFVLGNGVKAKIIPQNGYNHVAVKNGENYETPSKEIVLTNTTDISEIMVGKGSYGYCEPKQITMGIKLEWDNSAPGVVMEPNNEPNQNGYYNADVQVQLKVDDTDKGGGISEVAYQITDRGEEPEEGKYISCYRYQNGEAPKTSYIQEITVKAEDHNYADVRIYVKVTDRAGNEYLTEDDKICKLKICTTVPTITVSIDGTPHAEAAVDPEEPGYYYYNTARTAKITITDRSDVFDELAATEAICIQSYGKKGVGEPVDGKSMLSAWEHSGDEHTATIFFEKDAAYTWAVSEYKNKADLSWEAEAVEGESPYAFTVDKASPLTSKEASKDVSWIGFESTGWSMLAETLTFGVWKSVQKLTVVAEGKDLTSPVKAPLYYKTDATQALGKEELDQLYQEGQFQPEPYTLLADDQFAVYARLTDYAGNTVYISTDGVIIDMSVGSISIIPITEKRKNDFYTEDVDLEISVDDLQSEKKGVYSGIKLVQYTIENPETKYVESGTLFEFNKENPLKEELQASWKDNLTVDAKTFNASGIEVTVTAVDNAGNEFSESLKLNICTTKPVIHVTFMDKANKEIIEDKETGEKRGYFGQERRALVEIEDRPDVFDPEAVKDGLEVKAKDAAGNIVLDADKGDIEDMISSWTYNKDAHAYQADITFSEDGNYDWSISYENKAGLSCVKITSDGVTSDGVTYDGVTPQKFTVDKTDPSGELKIVESIGTEKQVRNEGKWFRVTKDIVHALSFGLCGQKSVTIEASGEDATCCGVDKEFYLVEGKEASSGLSWKDLEDLYVENKFVPYENAVAILDELNRNPEKELAEQFVAYLRVTDYAGNFVYICSDGYVVDHKKCQIIVDTTEEAKKNAVQISESEYIYNGDSKEIPVNIKVTDPDDYSGIAEVSYEVVRIEQIDGERKETITQEKTTLFPKEEGEREEGERCQTFEETINVSVADNNSSNVEVRVYAKDKAGNDDKFPKILKLDIDDTRPEIEVSYIPIGGSKLTPVNVRNGRGYFDHVVMANVTITERTCHFNEQKATDGIKITLKNAKGDTISLSKEDFSKIIPGEWKTEEKYDENGKHLPDAATHTMSLLFHVDANYTIDSISYTDEAGNPNQQVVYKNLDTPKNFTVDRQAPMGSIIAEPDGKAKQAEILTDLADSLTFGFWAKEKITVTRTAQDETSPIAKREYYKVSGAAATTLLTEDELEAITQWKSFDDEIKVKDKTKSGFVVKGNEQFVVYMKITDMAGNVCYLSSDGMVVDKNRPKVENIAPKVTITPEQPVNGIYNRDVQVKIAVDDPEAGNTYSGLKTVKYEILNMGKKTQEGTLYSFNKTNPKRSELKKKWSGKITVNSKLNNSNEVKIRVYAEDNAGNITSFRNNTESIKIDLTNPQISISYSNNSPDSGKYYSSDRVATVTVTERNFKAKDVITSIKSSGGTVPAITGWREVKGSGNGDNTKHIATITYHADGDYTFGINYTDLAGNRCPGAAYAAGTTNPTEFTIDQTAPVITVSYDNNDAQNGKYFKAKRTGTVTITEHNFDESRVEFTQTASLSGGSAAAPQASWSSSGDTHTATFAYDADGDYTFGVTMADMAGNKSGEASYGNSVAGQAFTVDTKIEKPVVEGVEDGKSYKGDVIPSISYNDVNFAGEEIQLLRTRKDEKDIDVTEKFITGLQTNGRGASGINDTFEKIAENDGIYTLLVKISDLAGNEETEKITFTVNRFGSVYVFDDYLVSLKDAYTKEIKEKLVITEYNPDKLKEDSLDILVTKDGAPLNNVKYTVTPVINDRVKVGDSGWYQYEYEIDTENFTADGIYQLIVASEDTAGNRPETTNFEDGDVLFRVDNTPPEITNVTGLEKRMVDAASQDVSFDVFDAIGLKQVTVYIDGIEVGFYDQFEDLVNYSGDITLQEGANQNVSLKVEDLAGNMIDTNEKNKEGKYTFQPEFAFVHSITVSTNIFIRWYANKMLFWGSIGGVAAAAALLFLILFLKKRKKEEG